VSILLDVLGVLLLLISLAALWMVSPWLALAAVCALLAAACLVLAYRRDVPRETEASE
jgi:ABC-type bacteriocin/lantibiotic exporter with double-glycine peptidase domain